jgi:hypothetical protein
MVRVMIKSRGMPYMTKLINGKIEYTTKADTPILAFILLE